MTITVYPVDAVSGAPLYSGRELRQTVAALAAGGNPTRPLGGISGVRPGSGVVGSATSTVWTVKPHAGQLDLEAAAEASVYLYAIDANQTGTMTAADGTNPRVDIVYLTLSDPAEGDGSSIPSVTPGYLAGTAAATPAAPAAPARSVVLFTIAVPKSGGGSPTVTMAAPEVGGAGAPVGVRSQAQRDALAKFAGLQVKRLDAGNRIETCDGTAWDFVDWTDLPIVVGGWDAPTGTRWQASREGNKVYFRGTLRNNPAAFSGFATICTLPAGIPKPLVTTPLVTSSNTNAQRYITVEPDGSVELQAETASGAYYHIGGSYRIN